MMLRARIRVESIICNAIGGSWKRKDVFLKDGLRGCKFARVKAKTDEGKVRRREA